MPAYNILYLPERIDITKLSQHKAFTAIPNFHADKLAYLLYIERYIRSLSPNSIKRNGYTKLHSIQLQSAVREYSQYYDVLEQLNIMVRDHSFNKELHFSFGYKLTDHYRSDVLKKYHLTSPVMREKMKKLATIKPEVVRNYKYLTKWFNKRLQINDELASQFYVIYKTLIRELSAKQWAESLKSQPTEEDKERFKLYYDEPVFQLYNVYRIAQGYYPISVDSTSYRMHTNLTILKSELRHALTYDNKQLVALDLSNSQPYFSLLLFNSKFWTRPLVIPEDDIRSIMGNRYRDVNEIPSPLEEETPYARETSLHISQFRKIALYLGLVKPTPAEARELIIRQQERKASNSRKSGTAITIQANYTERQEIYTTQQPFIIPLITLVYSLQKTEYEDVAMYFNLVGAGRLYEYLEAQWIAEGFKKPENRSELKVAVFQALFTANQFQGQPDAMPKQVFRNTFPNVTRVFEVIKTREPEQLPILLQSIESHLFLKVIAKRIAREKPRLPIFTIHDSIVTTVGNEAYVYQVMFEELSSAIGVAPNIKTEFYKAETLKQIIAKKSIDLDNLLFP